MSLSRRPEHASTTLTTASDSDHEDDPTIPPDEPWLFRLLNRANAFGEVISQHLSSIAGEKGIADEDGTVQSADAMDVLGRDLASMVIRKTPREETRTVERSLSSWRHSGPERLLNLSASSWFTDGRKSSGLEGSSGSDGEEEEPHKVEETVPPGVDGSPTLAHEVDNLPPPPTPPPLFDATDTPALSPQEKVALIISEFGALADGEEEKLLAEIDANFFQDVAILGVLHLTTHRITFHASLLSARPDFAPAKQVLYAGPVVVGKKGLRWRRRMWMELSHDMITTFRSSNEHDRVRPRKTVLSHSVSLYTNTTSPVTAFRKIYPVDLCNPRLVKIELSSAGAPDPPPRVRYPRFSKPSFTRLRTGSPASGQTKQSNCTTSKHVGQEDEADAEGDGDVSGVVAETLEFDTEEAAMSWRREMQAALYLSRRHRRDRVGRSSDADADEGVRISIPLAHIKKHERHVWSNLGTILQLELGPHAASSTQAGGFGAGIGDLGTVFKSGQLSRCSPLSRGWSTLQSVGSEEQQPSSRQGSVRLQFALMQSDVWDGLDEIVARAQARPPPADDPGTIVDFGSLTFVESGLDPVRTEGQARVVQVMRDSREKEVRRVFGLGDDLEIKITKCSLHRVISTSGLLVVSTKFVCFWSRLLAASDIKFRFYAEDVRAAVPSRVRHRDTGLTLQVRGQADIVFEFSQKLARDEVVHNINIIVCNRPQRRYSSRSDSYSLSAASPIAGLFPSVDSPTALLSPMSRTVAHLRERAFPPALLAHLTKPINVPDDIPYGISPRHFVCLTIGSRGDVQPYIALGRGLQAAGHKVTIVTHGEYKEWIEGWGIAHRTTGGDPGALMKLSVEHKMFSPQFFKESFAHFRSWIDQLLIEAWEQCKDADVLIESPPAMAGVHIAEALNIPYFRAFTMPWSRTTQYPHPFISPPVENSTRFNMASYVLFDNVFWLGTSGQINRWRQKHLGLPATDMGHLAQEKIPFVYNFSPSVVPKPLDWGDQITISGYWFLDNPDLNWSPPEQLVQFIAQARADHKPLVYIGFGSITVPNARGMTRSIIKAVLNSDVRAVLSKGWSSRMDKEEGPQIEFPPEIFAIDKAPHDWLFPQMTAALHHGGSGTTGASLRAGIPTLIKPWFGDQFFWASRVQRLGAGLKVASLRSADLSEALKKATTDRIMQEKAASVGERIRQEDGVPAAIKAIYTYLDRAGKNRTTLKK